MNKELRQALGDKRQVHNAKFKINARGISFRKYGNLHGKMP